MKNIIRLNENQLDSLINQILLEQFKGPTLNAGHFKYSEPNFFDKYIKHMSDGVYTDFDRAYDYKLEGSVWFAKHKNGTRWIDLTDYPKAITILTQKLEQHFKKPVPKPKPEDETKLTPQQKLMKAKACGFNSWIDYKSSGWKCGKKPTPKPVDKSDTIVSKTTNKTFINKIITNNKLISPTTSVPIFNAGQPECAQFVNDFDNQFEWVGAAWMAHNNDNLGSRIFSSFHNLNQSQIKQVIELWIKLDKTTKGGKIKAPNEFGNFVGTLVPNSPPVTLQLNDIIGIYLPSSPNHGKALYEGGVNDPNRPYIEKINGKYVVGNTIKSGKGWGMNTHLGIVGAIKDGVPIIFHNIHGQVFSDPFNKLTDNARIAWVRRPGGEPIALSKLKSQMSIAEQVTNLTVKKKSIYEQKPDNLMPFQPDNPGAKKIDYHKYDKYSCIIEPGFRPVIAKLISEGYNKTFLKAALGVVGRESSYSSGLRYNITSPLKIMASFFGSDTSIGPGQMKQSTAKDLKLKESITTIRGSLIAVYKYLQRSYQLAIASGYSTTKPSSNFSKGTGNAALDIAIASYNIGVGRIKKYCSTNDPKIKRSCSDAGKLVEQSVIGAPNMGVTTQKSTPKVEKTKYKVSNKVALNYLPNFKTERWDGVNISTHGYVEEVSKNIKSFNCF
jgi:hypothetical protein